MISKIEKLRLGYNSIGENLPSSYQNLCPFLRSTGERVKIMDSLSSSYSIELVIKISGVSEQCQTLHGHKMHLWIPESQSEID